jgi:TonB family protein
MTSLHGTDPQTMRSPWSFMGSICLHTWVLAWVALAPAIPSELKNPLSAREFPLQDQHIVWYKLSDRLPDVKPLEAKHDVRTLRARAKFEQNMVAGPKDTDRPPQLIFAPAPEIAPAKSLPLPNIVAVAPQRPPALPFTAPPVKPAEPDRTPTLPDAPKVGAAALDAGVLPIKVSGPQAPRFIPPKNPKLTFGSSEPASLPPAPAIGSSAAPNLSTPVSLPRQQEKFVPPAAHGPARAAEGGPTTISPPPPMLTANAAVPAGASLVIAGLDPAKTTEVPSPPGSMKGGFSGGPKPQPAGGEGTASGAMLEIPSLTIQGGAKSPQPPIMVASVSPTSPEGLAAALHAARGGIPAEGSAHGAVRAARAPDPRMYGRQVYTMAVQIPNLTSYSGSWVIWFASRQADAENTAVDLRPPLPLHMVSPRYVHSAQEDRVQGKVRLWAVIGKDGHVSDISLLQHLDDRLDASAEEALGKWLFQPAERNGSPIDVFAVFEIPFTLAPVTKPAR